MGEKKFKRTTVTAALPYANGGVHIGHLAGVYVPSDIYARYLRLKKKKLYSSEAATSTECLSLCVPRKRALHRKTCATVTTK